MSTTSTTTRFWLDPRNGQSYRIASPAHWLVENAVLVGLQAAVAGLDPDRDADELHLIGIRSGLIRITHNGTNLFVQYYAGPAHVESVVHAVRDFLRNHDLLAIQFIRIRNSHNGNERTLPLASFIEIVDYGGLLFPTLSTTKKRLLGLVIGHLAFGWSLALIVGTPQRDALGVLFITLVFSEVGLLGIWGSLVQKFELYRPLGLIAGLAYLLAIMRYVVGEREFEIFKMLIFGAFGLTLFVMVTLRCTRLGLHLVAPTGSIPASTAFQYSIRQLMAVTAAVAILFAVARSVSQEPGGSIAVRYAPCLAMPPLMAAWATLGSGRLSRRIPAVLVMSLLPGLIPVLFYEEQFPSWFWPSNTLSEGIISLISLLIIRSCGYRLLRVSQPIV